MKSKLSFRFFVALLVLFFAVALVFFLLGVFAEYKFLIYKGGPLSINKPYNFPSISGKCERYDSAPKDEFLETYIVKKGDTLLGIVKEKLGDSSRYQALIDENYEIFKNQDKNEPFIEVGWKLYIPFKDVPDRYNSYWSFKKYGEVLDKYPDLILFADRDNPGGINYSREQLGPYFEDIKKGECLVLTGINTARDPHIIRVDRQ